MHKNHFNIAGHLVLLEITPNNQLFQVLVDALVVSQVRLAKEHGHSRWYCQQCSSDSFIDKEHILQHAVIVHSGLPHPLGVRPAVSTGPSQAALYKLAGVHSDPTYDQAIYNICHPHLAYVR